MNTFSSIPEAIKEIKKGKMLIIVDSPDRENQGDIVFPAETATPEKINFLIKECRGLVCVSITKSRATQLNLPPSIPLSQNTEKLKSNFTVSVDAKNVSSFGISASDRALTARVLAGPLSKPNDLIRPGHVFPLVTSDGGILARAGHTEATVEITRLAGFTPCAVLCEILRDDGEVARIPDLIAFSQKFDLKIISITDLIDYVKK